MLEYVDLVLYDIKHTDDVKHKKYTGVSNELILSNLKNILKTKQEISIRVPVIPGFNDAVKKKIERFVGSIKSGARIEYLDYHEYGKFKYRLLGRMYTYNP
jgi:pyruvate formate lyase activating enzyme